VSTTLSNSGIVLTMPIEDLAKWRQYLLNVMEPFEIWMDYKNLKYFKEPHKLNRRQAR